MIIKNNNKAVDVLKNQHVCWEGQKKSQKFYVKKTISYGKWTIHKDPETIPSISWEGGTTVNCKVWFLRTNTIREGFNTRTEDEKRYVEPTGMSDRSDVTFFGNYVDGYSAKFSKRDDATTDLELQLHYMFDVSNDGYTYDSLYAGKYLYIMAVYKQTKRDKYVTKLDNASIDTELIPASGGNISSGKLTYRKTYNTGETENVTENVTFSTVSATTKGITESDVTVVKTIASGGTIQKETTIDSVTLTHPSFTVKQAANVKSVKTAESKKTTNVILSVSPTTVYSSGGLVTFSLLRMYTLNKVVYLYTSGSTSGGGSDTNQGPETVSANSNYTVTGVNGVTSVRGGGYLIPSSTTERTIKFQTTYDNVKSNEATVTLKLDGPDTSKAFTYSDLKITNFSYNKNSSGYHFPASGGTISATDCTLEGTYQWTYTSMENKTVTETVNWTFADLTTNMYTFTPTSVTAKSLGATETSENLNYNKIAVTVKNLTHTYNGKSYNVKNSSGTALSASTTATLTMQGNLKEQSTISKHELSISVSPTSYTYTGGPATLTSSLITTSTITWTSGSTSEQKSPTDVTSSTTFTCVYKISGQAEDNPFSFSGTKPTIPNILSSTAGRTYTFTGKYGNYSGTAKLSQTGNTVLYTATFYINNTYGKWSKSTNNEYITKQFSLDTPYTELIPDETPEWKEGSNYKYEPTGKYSLTTQGTAVTSSSLLKKDTSLYAIWKTPTNYIKITFDPDDGAFKKTSDESKITTDSIYGYYGSGNINCLPSDLGWSNDCTKTNFIFAGWSNNLATYTKCPINFDNQGSAVTFTAQYISDKVTITWDANGGLFSDNKSSKTLTIKRYGSLNTAYTENPTKASTESTIYTFKGWNTNKNASTILTFPETNVSYDTTYYAIYSSTTKTFDVTWSNTYKESNIAVFSDNTVKDKITSADYGTEYKSLTAPNTTSPVYNTAKDTEYQTALWFDNNDYKTLISASTKKVTSACTVYLKYKTVNYKLTLNSGGGEFKKSDGTKTTEVSTMILGNTDVDVDLKLTFNKTPSGKEFIGWAKKSDATSADISTKTTAAKFNISEPTTYYAIFTTSSYKIIWNNTISDAIIWKDGTVTSKESSAEYGTKYSVLTAPAQLADPIKNSKDTIRYKTADGWYTAPKISDGIPLSQSSETVTSNPTNVYLPLPAHLYKTTFNPNGGTIKLNDELYTSSNPYIIYPIKDSTIDIIISTRDNYIFKGWSTNINDTNGSTDITITTPDATYYAIWQAYGTINLNPNGGTLTIDGNVYITTYTFRYMLPSLNLSTDMYPITKTGYTFVGWNEDKDATTGNLSVTLTNENVFTGTKTYYAIWKSNKLTPILLVLSE